MVKQYNSMVGSSGGVVVGEKYGVVAVFYGKRLAEDWSNLKKKLR